jgi:hypothetical protein
MANSELASFCDIVATKKWDNVKNCSTNHEEKQKNSPTVLSLLAAQFNRQMKLAARYFLICRVFGEWFKLSWQGEERRDRELQERFALTAAQAPSA